MNFRTLIYITLLDLENKWLSNWKLINLKRSNIFLCFFRYSSAYILQRVQVLFCKLGLILFYYWPSFKELSQLLYIF